MQFPVNRLLKDQRRQARVIDLDRKVRESFSNSKDPSKGPPQGPEGFLEGALMNQDVAAAHEKFMSDVQVSRL